jgi:hypothetical protein
VYDKSMISAGKLVLGLAVSGMLIISRFSLNQLDCIFYHISPIFYLRTHNIVSLDSTGRMLERKRKQQ